MAISLLGQDAMRILLAAQGRVLVVNRTEPDDSVFVVAAAVVRHRGDGTTQSEATLGLDLAADESIALDALPPEAARPEAVEVLMRISVGEAARMVDAYVVARASDEDPDAPFEVGIRRHDGLLGDGEELLPDFEAFAIYGLPAG